MTRAKKKTVPQRSKKKKVSGKSPKKKQPEKQATGKLDSKPGKHFKPGNKIGKKYWWKPGQSGNPKGKPKGIEFTTALKALLNQPITKVPFIRAQCERLGIEVDPADKKTTVLEVVMAATLTQVVHGKGDILKHMWERMEGAIPKTLHLEGDPFDDYLLAMKDKTSFDQMKDKD